MCNLSNRLPTFYFIARYLRFFVENLRSTRSFSIWPPRGVSPIVRVDNRSLQWCRNCAICGQRVGGLARRILIIVVYTPMVCFDREAAARNIVIRFTKSKMNVKIDARGRSTSPRTFREMHQIQDYSDQSPKSANSTRHVSPRSSRKSKHSYF